MGQVTIYLDNETENKLKMAAKSDNTSVSKWIARLIRERIKTDWPSHIADLAGSWQDDFPSPEEIRSDLGQDCPREDF